MRAVLLLLALLPCISAANVPPPLVLWAWEREEDLRFLDPQTTGVAYLAQTIHLRGEQALVRPRLQPLRVPKGIYLIAVVRIEPDRRTPPLRNEAQRSRVAGAIAGLGRKPGLAAVQIDYDATVSERPFYSALLTDLRRRLPPGVPITITALASWCSGDRWISNLPVEDAVPMLFRMGPDGSSIRQDLAQGKDFPDPLCRNSMGISTDEPGVPLIAGRRIYAFHKESWTSESVAELTATLNRWSRP